MLSRDRQDENKVGFSFECAKHRIIFAMLNLSTDCFSHCCLVTFGPRPLQLIQCKFSFFFISFCSDLDL